MEKKNEYIGGFGERSAVVVCELWRDRDTYSGRGAIWGVVSEEEGYMKWMIRVYMPLQHAVVNALYDYLVSRDVEKIMGLW